MPAPGRRSPRPGALALGGGAERAAPAGGLAHRLDDHGMGVPEDRRAVGLHVVEQLATLDVPDAGAFPPGHEVRVPPTDRNARTGEFTPPGMQASPRRWSSALVVIGAPGRAGRFHVVEVVHRVVDEVTPERLDGERLTVARNPGRPHCSPVTESKRSAIDPAAAWSSSLTRAGSCSP